MGRGFSPLRTDPTLAREGLRHWRQSLAKPWVSRSHPVPGCYKALQFTDGSVFRVRKGGTSFCWGWFTSRGLARPRLSPQLT